jgi:hypothetical protein
MLTGKDGIDVGLGIRGSVGKEFTFGVDPPVGTFVMLQPSARLSNTVKINTLFLFIVYLLQCPYGFSEWNWLALRIARSVLHQKMQQRGFAPSKWFDDDAKSSPVCIQIHTPQRFNLHFFMMIVFSQPARKDYISE